MVCTTLNNLTRNERGQAHRRELQSKASFRRSIGLRCSGRNVDWAECMMESGLSTAAIVSRETISKPADVLERRWGTADSSSRVPLAGRHIAASCSFMCRYASSVASPMDEGRRSSLSPFWPHKISSLLYPTIRQEVSYVYSLVLFLILPTSSYTSGWRKMRLFTSKRPIAAIVSPCKMMDLRQR